jgi:hypothetical protein
MIVDVKKGDKINFKLLPGITINSNPQGAMVKIDGKLICQTTPCQRVVDEGQREIVLQKELYATKTQMINVQRGKDIKIDLDPDFGWLEIKSPYDGVDVFLDGKNIGKTPIPKMQITPGPHLIEPKGDCFNTVPEQIIVEKLKVKSVSLSIQEKSAAIEVYSKDEKGNDIEADVFVDGKNVGTSPGTFKIPLCSKEAIVINGDGLKYVYGLTLFEKYTSDVIAVFERNSTSSNYEDDAFDRDSYDEYSSNNNFDDEHSFNRDSKSKIRKTHKTRPYIGVGVGFLVTGVLSFGAAGLSHYLMTTYNDDARAKFDPEDTSKSKEFVDKAKSAEIARNVLIGVGAGFSTLGIIMFFITKEQPVAVYVDEKGFIISYNFKF